MRLSPFLSASHFPWVRWCLQLSLGPLPQGSLAAMVPPFEFTGWQIGPFPPVGGPEPSGPSTSKVLAGLWLPALSPELPQAPQLCRASLHLSTGVAGEPPLAFHT